MAKQDRNRDQKGKFVEGNTISIGNNGGRPPTYKNPDELSEMVAGYFEWIKGEYEIKSGTRVTKEKDDSGKIIQSKETFEYKFWKREPEIPSITGLAIYLGFESRQSLYEYSKKPEFTYSIKKALLKIENNYEKGLWNDRCTGVIFALKNMSWVDKTEIESTNKHQVDLTKYSEEQKKVLLELARKNG